MKRYTPAGEDVLQRLWTIAKTSHADVVEHKVTIGVVFVWVEALLPVPCLTQHGYDAIAIVSKTPTKHRVKGAPDAMIEIDKVRWDELGEAEQDALLDHQLTHLIVATDDGGHAKRDGCGRPRLWIRLHDHQYGWFDNVAMRHGAASQEVREYVRHYEQYHQRWFAFAAERRSGGRRATEAWAAISGGRDSQI